MQGNQTSRSDVIIVEDLWKTYKIPVVRQFKLHEYLSSIILRKNRGYIKLPIFEGISFRVKEGESLGIIGDNGSGKSTLLKILARIIYPDKGHIQVKGRIAPFIELGAGFDYDYTAVENIFLYGAIMGLSRNYITKVLPDIFEFAELEKFRLMKLRNFSTGMMLRLAFATAIQMNSDILLIDEVLAVGDKDFQKKCINKIFEYKQKKKTIMFVSHALSKVQEICDNSLWLKKGEIASYGKSEKVIKDYEDYIDEKVAKRLEGETKKL